MKEFQVDLINLTKLQTIVINYNNYYEVGNKLIKLDLTKSLSELYIETEKEYDRFSIFDLKEAVKFVENYINADDEYKEHVKRENEYDDYNVGWENV